MAAATTDLVRDVTDIIGQASAPEEIRIPDTQLRSEGEGAGGRARADKSVRTGGFSSTKANWTNEHHRRPIRTPIGRSAHAEIVIGADHQSRNAAADRHPYPVASIFLKTTLWRKAMSPTRSPRSVWSSP